MRAVQTDQAAELAQGIKQRAAELGFDLCGITDAVPSAFKAEYRSWIERGMHGEMGYLARDPDRRLNPNLVLPGVQSIVAVAMNYYTESEADNAGPNDAIFARYARNEDYHDVMLPRLKELLAWIKKQEPEVEGRAYVDTGPILEREVARRAGLGWFGKNTMLINTRRGSWFLLGELLLTLHLPPDAPAVGGCGTCTRCIDACPTNAIIRPYEIDSRRCISYLTIEQRGSIPTEFAEKMGNRIFGCDICNEVCPFNERRATPTSESAFQPRSVLSGLTLNDIIRMSDDDFRGNFKGSPVKRSKRRGLLRNAAAAQLSLDASNATAALEIAQNDSEPLVREQAEKTLAAIRK